MKASIKIRQADKQDVQAVGEVYIRSRLAAVPNIPASVHTDEETRSWVTNIVIPAQNTWVAVTETGQVVAMMSLGDGWVDQLYVDPGWNGQGIGSKLLQLAKEKYPNGLQLWTFESNHGARHFYERHGFLEIDREDGSCNEEGAPAILYRWKV